MGTKQPSLRPVLLSFLIIGLVAVAVAYGLVQGMRSASSGADFQRMRVYRDSGGDLWVETPRFIWNITGGEQITDLTAGRRVWQPEDHQTGSPIVDRLFLASSHSGPLWSRIIFSLPDRAIVYLERESAEGAEGVELAFRASDGIVRVTHSWLGEQVPEEVLEASAGMSNLEGQLVQEMMEGLDADQRLHLAANYSYFVRFDPATQDVDALALQQAEGQRIGAFYPLCSTQSQAGGAAQQDPWQREPGDSPIHDPCQFLGFYVPGRILGSEYLILSSSDPAEMLQPAEVGSDVPQLEAADLDAAYITRTPRYSFRAEKRKPATGDLITFVARVANPGAASTGTFGYLWSVDGSPVLTGTHPSLEPGEGITLPLEWRWSSGTHTLTLQLDPEGAITEVSEWNNRLSDRMDALGVGFWVEQSVYDHFGAHQVERGLGSVSWEDWAQRQLALMNDMFANAIHPLTPEGILDRVRLDKVTVVPDGTLPPCEPNLPAPDDETVDLQWGFPAEMVGVDSGHQCGSLDYYASFPMAQDVDYSLLHELGHARYLVDLAGLDVRAPRVLLSSSIGRSATSLTADKEVEKDSGFPIPTYLAVDGELIVCQAKVGGTFEGCERGAEGTRARSHAAGTPVQLAVVRLQDGRGNLIQGSDQLPALGDVLYRNLYPNDLMSGGVVYEEHSAYAWNRIAGERPCCGNANAPGNIGEYLNDLPAENVLELQDGEGRPIAGAEVALYRAEPLPTWYGKLFVEPPAQVVLTNAAGQAALGRNPFTGGPGISHRYGYSNAVVLLGITAGGEVVYQFIDVTQANVASWSGQEEATYRVTVPW